MQRNPFVSDGQGRERPIDELFDEEPVDAVELHVLSQRRRANSLLSTVTTLLPPSSSPPPAHDQAPSRLLADEEDGRGSSPSDVVSLLHDGDDDHHSSGSQFDGKLSFSEAWRLIGRSLKLALVVCAVLLIASLLGFFVLFFSSQPGSCVNDSNNATHLSNTTDSPPPIPLPDLAPGYFDNDLYYENYTRNENGPYPSLEPLDMARADRLGSFVLSPDRTKVAFTRRVWNVLLNRSSTTLYVLTVLPQAGLPEAVTPPAWGVSDSDPNWSADGAFLLFLSNRLYNASSSNSGLIGPDPSGDRQIWQLRLSTGDLSRVSSFPLPLSALLVSPDSSSAAFAISLIPGTSIIQTAQILSSSSSSSSSSSLSSCPTFSSLSSPAAALQLPSTAGAQYRVYDRLMVRHWDQWATRCRSHVFLQRLSYHPSAQGFSLSTSSQPIDVVEASPSLLPFASDVPTFDGGREEWSFSPDGMRFAFTVHQDDSTTRHAFSTDLNVYLYDLSSRVLSCVSCANPAADSSPSFSPDGSTLSYLAMTVPGYESDRRIPTLYSLSSSTTSSSDPHPLPLTADWPSSPHQLMWRSSSHLIATTLQSGRHHLFLLDTNSPTPVNTDSLTSFFSGGSVDVVGSGSGADEEVLVLAMSSFLHPTELFLLKGGQLQQVTHFSRLLCAKAGLDRVEMAVSDSSDIARLSFSGADDETVEGWYFRGARRRGAQRMPLAVLIHGGPQGSWADGWSYRWNPVVFASRGYCVALIDFHGSTGYGQGFTDSIRADYGGKPFLDMEKGVEHVLARYSFEVDPSNLHALGASYGGYMVNWLNGHSLQQYRSLVVHDGIFSLHSLFYETDELWFPSHDLLGTPWDSPDPSSPCFPQTCYSKWDPSAAVSHWSTPALVIHGGRDYRIPDTHALSVFTALQARQVRSRLVLFPTENHWVLNPANSMAWHAEVFNWIDEFSH